MIRRAQAFRWAAVPSATILIGMFGLVAPGAAHAAGTVPAPTNVTGQSGAGEVTVSWTDLAALEGSPPDSYDVYYSTSQGSGYQLSADCTDVPAGDALALDPPGFPGGGSGSGPSCTVTGLTNGTPYYFEVVATLAGDDSSFSSPSDPVTPAGLPGPPTITSAAGGIGSASVSWSAPIDDGGADLIKYYVFIAPATTPDTDHATRAGGSCGGLSGVIASTTSCTVSGLDAGSYVFFVSAYNGAGDGQYAGQYSTASSEVTVTSAAPGAPANVTATASSAGQATIAWDAPEYAGDSSLTGFDVQIATSPSGSFSQALGMCATDSLSGSSTTCNATGLTNGTPYRVKVAARNNGHTSAYTNASSTVTPTGPPDTPGSVTAYASRGSAVLTWTAPASNGAAITSYKVQVATSPSDSWGDPSGTCASPSVSALSCTASGLTNDTSYRFKVLAHNSSGDGSYSSATSPVTPTPGALPEQLTARCPSGSCNGADLIGLNLSGLNLAGVDLTGANLTGANLAGANLAGANLNGATLTAATTTGINLAGANLSGATLIAIVGTGGNYHGANFTGATLVAAKLGGSDLIGANFTRANLVGTSRMSPKSHRRAIATRTLGAANFAGAKLNNANFNLVKANKVVFTGAALTRAKFIGAHLAGANLSKVKARNAKFTKADLTGANLTRADVRGADFRQAKIKKIKLKGAKYNAKAFGKAKR